MKTVIAGLYKKGMIAAATIAVFTSAAFSLTYRGWVRSQFDYGITRSEHPTLTLAGIQPDKLHPMLDINTELRHTFYDKLTLYWDGGVVLNTQEPGNRLLLNEGMVQINPIPHLELWAGKRRSSWSTSLAFTPIDIIYPAKNPVEPAEQREGRYGSGVILTFDRSSFRALWFPQVTENHDGVPDKIDPENSTYAGSAYINLWESDVTFMYASINKHHHGGLSFSRYFTNDLEIHAEGLLSQNRPSIVSLPAAVIGMDPIDTNGVYGQACIGMRYGFLNQKGILSVEYYYNGAGISADQFDQLTDYSEVLLNIMQKSPAQGSRLFSTQSSSMYRQLLTNRILQNYLAATVQYNDLWEYFNPSIAVIVGLDDYATMAVPSLEYRIYETVLLKVSGTFIVGDSRSQFGLMPFSIASMARMTVFF
jgi:hypothetical protein